MNSHICRVAGINFTNHTLLQATGHILSILRQPSNESATTVSFINSYLVAQTMRDADLAQALGSFDINYADGWPIVAAAHCQWDCAGLPERVPGPDVMESVMDACQQLPVRHFFLGVHGQVMEQLLKKIAHQMPGVYVAASYVFPYSNRDTDLYDPKMVTFINNAQVDMLWVSLGSPYQEKWLSWAKPLLKVKLAAVVGYAFDIFSGHKKRAPMWMRVLGLEWLFRLYQDPGKQFRRYLEVIRYFLPAVISRAQREPYGK